MHCCEIQHNFRFTDTIVKFTDMQIIYFFSGQNLKTVDISHQFSQAVL